MVAGAVIIGRSIGFGMTRPFTTLDYRDLREKCGLSLIANCPVEVAYPHCFEKDSEFEYVEGVLVNIRGYGGAENVEDFENEIKKRLVISGKIAESLYNKHVMGKIAKPWYSDLCDSKVIHQSSGDDGIIYTPYMQILETYPEKEMWAKYSKLAIDLVSKTRDARIERAEKIQGIKANESIERIAHHVRNHSKLGL